VSTFCIRYDNRFLVALLGHFCLSRSILKRSPVERIHRAQGPRRITIGHFACILAQGKAVDARDGAGEAVSVVALTLEEIRRNGEIVSITNSTTSGSAHEPTCANARVEVELETVERHGALRTVDLLGCEIKGQEMGAA
jgi:hypothetical protein